MSYASECYWRRMLSIARLVHSDGDPVSHGINWGERALARSTGPLSSTDQLDWVDFCHAINLLKVDDEWAGRYVKYIVSNAHRSKEERWDPLTGTLAHLHSAIPYKERLLRLEAGKEFLFKRTQVIDKVIAAPTT